MSKVRDNSAPKMILGARWGARTIASHSSPSLSPEFFGAFLIHFSPVLCII